VKRSPPELPAYTPSPSAVRIRAQRVQEPSACGCCGHAKQRRLALGGGECCAKPLRSSLELDQECTGADGSIPGRVRKSRFSGRAERVAD